jgi:hypothetical protein
MTYCCEHCFKDRAISDIINNMRQTGDCSYCGAKHVHVYDLNSDDTTIHDLLVDIFSLYVPTADGDDITTSLLKEWEIIGPELHDEDTLARLLHDLFPEDEIRQRITQPAALHYTYRSSLLAENTWQGFADYLKHSNRFYVPFLDTDSFKEFFESSSITYRAASGTTYSRARIASDPLGFDNDHMSAPPQDKATPGRINPTGISELYLSSDEKTAIHEIRSGMHDWVTLGTFRITQDIRIVNLSAFNAGSPFEADNVDLEKYLSNKKVLREMSTESARRMRRSDNPIDYLPTQYIAELAKGHNFDGVQFNSTLSPGGMNICLFDPKKAHCESTRTVQIYGVDYEFH